MTTATIQKELKKVIETQKHFEVELNFIKKAIDEHAFEEVRPEYLKKLEKISREVKNGKGVRFNSPRELKNYFKKL